jgi:hypothetical protein
VPSLATNEVVGKSSGPLPWNCPLLGGNRVLRGVSDLSDARKASLDQVGRGALRGGTRLQAPLGVHQFNTTLCPAVTVAGRMLLPSLTEYFPAGKETGWLTCLDASCVPEASSTA